ncbi:MAG: hypothetical protein CFE33_20235 [Pseudorhodobacter sp. PARRP1]|nr:MAG: hypothetical protein CFE33_20235 [Pseudorhodobacter sp. PARRP1]
MLEEEFLRANPEIIDACEAQILKKMKGCSEDKLLKSPLVGSAIQAAFLGSLEQDEGRSFPFVVKYHPDHLCHPDFIDRFEMPLTLDPKTISKLAPAILPTRKAILVSIVSGEFRIIGVGDTSRPTFVLSSLRPGTLSVDFSFNKDLIDRIAFLTRTRTLWLPNFLRVYEHSDWRVFNAGLAADSLEFRLRAFSEILKRIYLYQRGAIVILAVDTDWRLATSKGSKFNITTSGHASNNRLSRFKNKIVKFRSSNLVNDIATASRVDGATILDKDFNILAFGAKLRPRDSSNLISKVSVTDSSWRLHDNLSLKPISEVGGMRHQSSSQFAYDMRKSHVITVSEDGPITWQFWSDKHGSVVSIKNAESFIL